MPLAPMLAELPFKVCANRSTIGASPPNTASSSAESLGRASSRNMLASSVTMSASPSPCRARRPEITCRSNGSSGCGSPSSAPGTRLPAVTEIHFPSTFPSSLRVTGLET